MHILQPQLPVKACMLLSKHLGGSRAGKWGEEGVCSGLLDFAALQLEIAEPLYMHCSAQVGPLTFAALQLESAEPLDCLPIQYFCLSYNSDISSASWLGSACSARVGPRGGGGGG